MKRILFTFLFVAAFLAGYSQMQNNGGTITVEANATLVIQGDYTSTLNGVIEIDGNVQLKGNFVNNSGNIHANSTGLLKFNGTAPQQISGTAPTDFYCAVEVDNAGNGVSLTGADAVLYSALTLTNGKFTLTAYDLTMAAVGITATSTNYVVTGGTGELKATVGAVDVTYPVGTASSYNPVILNNTGGTSDTYGVVYSGIMPIGWTGTDDAVTGHWTVTEGTAGGSNLDVTTQWNLAQEQTNFDRTDCAIGVSPDLGATMTWGAFGAAGGTNPYTRLGENFTSVGTFLVGDSYWNAIVMNINLFLAGPYNATTGTMSLALNPSVPVDDPYDNGPNAPSIPATAVDWVEVELRNQATPSLVEGSFSFFVDNTGTLMNIDGTANPKMSGIAKSQYYVAVRHRNHLGAMTSSTIDFTGAGPFAFDFGAGVGIYGTDAMQSITGAFPTYALWAGNTNGDNEIVFQGSGNDPTPVGNVVSNDPGNTLDEWTYPVYGYYDEDVNLDGIVIFQGTNNDPTPIGNTVSVHPGNTLDEFTYRVVQQLP